MPGFWDQFRQFSSGMNEKHNALWQRTQTMADMRQKDMQFQHGLMSDYLKNQLQLSEIGANLGVEQARDIRERDLGKLKSDTDITTTRMGNEATIGSARLQAQAQIAAARTYAKQQADSDLIDLVKSDDQYLRAAALEVLESRGIKLNISVHPPKPPLKPVEIYREPRYFEPQPNLNVPIPDSDPASIFNRKN